MTISRKIGLHIFGGTSAPLGRPTVVKLVDPSEAYYRQVRAAVGPDCLIVVRWYHDAQPLDEPAANALDWYRRHEWFINAIPASERVVYEGWNEIGDAQAASYAIFERARLQLLHNIGRHGCVGNWSVGCPDFGAWPLYAPALAVMNEGDVVGLHEYWSDHADIDNVWHVRRFTLPPVAAHLGNRRIVITECGRDVVENKGAAGWQHTTNEAGFLDDLRRAGELYAACPNVIGATVYQTGSVDPKWSAFNVFHVWPRVVAEYDSAPTPNIPESPDSSPQPQPSLPLSLVPPIRREDIARNADGTPRITQRWNPPTHYGIDYSCVVGTPIYASCDGIAYRGSQPSGFGLYIRVEDGNGLYVYCAHLQAWAVADGALVQAGDLIGYSGNTGNSTGPHLHFEVRRAAPGAPRPTSVQGAIDPEPLLYWPEDAEPAPGPLPYLPTNDPSMLARVTPVERMQGIRWWMEERRRQHEAGEREHADAIDLALIEQMYVWEGEG